MRPRIEDTDFAFPSLFRFFRFRREGDIHWRTRLCILASPVRYLWLYQKRVQDGKNRYIKKPTGTVCEQVTWALQGFSVHSLLYFILFMLGVLCPLLVLLERLSLSGNVLVLRL